jgi:transposase-like protein
MRGRRPAGPEYVDKLNGSNRSKQRLRVILQTLSGELSVQEACTILGIKEVRFHQLRQRALQGSLNELEPRAAGRPRLPSTAEQRRLVELEHELATQRLELHEAQVREEVALILPHVLVEEAEPGKKTRRR